MKNCFSKLSNQIKRSTLYTSFNLMYLATWLRENGHSPVIIDGGMLRIHTDELAKLVEKENPI